MRVLLIRVPMAFDVDSLLGKYLVLYTIHGATRKLFYPAGTRWLVLSYAPEHRMLTVLNSRDETRSQLPLPMVKRAIAKGVCDVE